MTQYYHKKGNRIVKYALLTLIADIMKSNATAHFVWLDEGYENDNQRIHFSSDGTKYMLEGVGCPDLEDGSIVLKITSTTTKQSDKVLFFLPKLHINTLEKIACEVYDTLRDPEKDDEYDIVRDDYVSGYLDTYLAR